MKHRNAILEQIAVHRRQRTALCARRRQAPRGEHHFARRHAVLVNVLLLNAAHDDSG
eukprot:NODE_13235_length_1177_cov_5.702857.p9 GENE.NODE_13235_length_1177_cov_5.702857~~NODE_13235_length_1177_cov_5.702857.p9  ORF type:complete len:57 (+),score=12.16 NODE_13235_length_1177_cov_5.702857:776-946(+)